MSELWIALDDFPAEGRDFSFSDAALWSETWRDLHLAGSVQEMNAEVRIAPRGDGGLVKGSLQGRVILPCGRCAEDFETAVENTFSVFEQPGGDDGQEEVPDEDSRIREEDGVLQLNVGAILWEQLMLALPLKPVCKSSCKGLCDLCGANRNLETCDCVHDDPDPRMAAFRNLKVT